ncbi:MAG: TolC family protein [Nitrospirae bacterium]|nr:TolC family protein [Nitrospirota bacterium]
MNRESCIVNHASCIMHRASLLLIAVCCLLSASSAFADDLMLQDLIDDALKNNHDLIVSGFKVSTSEYRIPQAQSLPDPMFMVGYQNEGWDRYTYGEMEGAQWMFSASQMFPFPGKRLLKGEMAVRDAEGLKALYESKKVEVIEKVKELYYDLFLTYKDIDLIRDKTNLFSRMEDAALARYSSGMAPQQEVLMTQTEKYMLIEREEMIKQRQQAIEAMLNTTVGRDVNSPLGRPVEPVYMSYTRGMDELLNIAYEKSPEVISGEKMVAGAEAKVRMAEKEYYPDFTLAASLFKRRGEFEDMWSLTTTVNIPIFYRTKQRMAVLEAKSSLSEVHHELDATKIMLSSGIRENYSMLRTAEKLMELYKSGLMPKAYQDFESAIAGYTTGRIEAITVITRLKALIDYELLYWSQFVEREKAIARLEALTGGSSQGEKEK